MKKSILSHISCLLAFALTACAGANNADEPSDEELLATVEQPVGIAQNGGSYYWGVLDTPGVPHQHRRCSSGSSTCSLPRTKGPTYKLIGLTAAQQTLVRAAFTHIDGQVNWTFTETTGANPTISVNNIDNFCGDVPVGDIQRYACINLTAQANTLTESPSAIPNTYTEHTNGVLHLDQAAVNAFVTGQTSRDALMKHAVEAAILSWMGAGLTTIFNGSPSNVAVFAPYTTGNLTAGEVCKLNAFLPAAQYGSSTTIGYITGSPFCAD